MPTARDGSTVQQTALITGCSSGIGRATAETFLEEGWTVYATARRPADVQTLGEAGCELATLDVTDPDDVDRVVTRVLDETGTIDALVNNAGYGQFGPVEDVTPEGVHGQFAVNVYGPHRLIRAALPAMRREGDGTIVNVSSVAGRVAVPGGGVYSSSKFALEALSDALRNEVREFGVDVVVVEPGPVRTQFSDRVSREADPDETDGIERSGAYDDFYALFEDAQAIGGDGPGAVDPVVVAEAIVDAAAARNPPARVQPGTPARIGVLARFLPDSVRDRGFDLLRKLTS